jgi:hypothetical protein
MPYPYRPPACVARRGRRRIYRGWDEDRELTYWFSHSAARDARLFDVRELPQWTPPPPPATVPLDQHIQAVLQRALDEGL